MNKVSNMRIGDPSTKIPTNRTANIRHISKILAWAGLAGTLVCGQSALALTLTPVSQGLLPSGDVIVNVLITLDPGDTVPWHFHTGRGWGTLISGVLTEDEGCGNALNVYSAGSAFSEIPGRVHRVFNFGTVPVQFMWTEIYPACDPNGGTIFVAGPNCEGNSGRSHLEKIPACP